MQPETFTVTARHKGTLSSPAALANFTLEPLSGPGPEGLVYAPYAIDFETRAVIEVGIPADLPVAQRPFFYLDQYHDARTLRRVPVQAYIDAAPGPGARQRVFVFSIGRAGSTLVSKILDAGDIASISEPDVLLDLGKRAHMTRLDLERPDWGRLYGACVAALEARFSNPEIIATKFRAQSSNRFHVRALHEMFPEAQNCFVFRDVADWSRSFASKFGFRAETLKWVLSENLQAAAMLKRRGARLRILRYEEIVASPERVLEGLVDAQAIARAGDRLQAVLGRDSQEGMFSDAPPDPAALAEQEKFLAWWADNRPVDQLAALGLEDL